MTQKDHLVLARQQLEGGDAFQMPVENGPPCAQYAIAHALIALVERLDALTVVDTNGVAGLVVFTVVAKA